LAFGRRTVHQLMEARMKEARQELDATEARQGVISGRVVTVLTVSMTLIGVIFALILLIGR
jgi:hypothetical protein